LVIVSSRRVSCVSHFAVFSARTGSTPTVASVRATSHPPTFVP
jgi:nitrite reductase/ring-hydroxylating ferredoxin subunit